MIAAAFLLLAQAPAGSAEALALESLEETDPGETCEDPQTQSALNACAYLNFARADDELNAQWRETTAVMRSRDAELLPDLDKQPGYLETLRNAQRAWLTFRDEHCQAESFMARGGTMQPMLVSLCRTYLTRQRIEQLRELTASLSVEE